MSDIKIYKMLYRICTVKEESYSLFSINDYQICTDIHTLLLRSYEIKDKIEDYVLKDKRKIYSTACGMTIPLEQSEMGLSAIL